MKAAPVGHKGVFCSLLNLLTYFPVESPASLCEGRNGVPSFQIHDSRSSRSAHAQTCMVPRTEKTMPSSSNRFRNPSVRPAWYKARQKAISPAQKRAERALWPLFGLAFSHTDRLELRAAFNREAPRVLEIGCGNGEAVVELAAARPDVDFLAVDWMRRGLATCMMKLDERGLSNVRVCKADGAMLLTRGLPTDTPLFDEVLFFFPNPHPHLKGL